MRKGGLCHIDVLYCIISFFLSFTPGLLNTLLHPTNRLPHTAWPWPLYPHSIDSSSQYWFRHYPNLKTQAQKQNMCIYSVSFFYLLLVSGSIEKILFLCLYIFFFCFSFHLFFLHCQYGEGNQACDLYLLVNLLVPWSEVTAEDMLLWGGLSDKQYYHHHHHLHFHHHQYHVQHFIGFRFFIVDYSLNCHFLLNM